MEISGRIMYFSTRSASAFGLARTKLLTLKPVCRQERIRSAHSGLNSSLRTRSARTSRAKISAGQRLRPLAEQFRGGASQNEKTDGEAGPIDQHPQHWEEAQ